MHLLVIYKNSETPTLISLMTAMRVDMGIYFISDPDGYWIEIIPEKK